MAKNDFKKNPLTESPFAVAHINGFLEAVSWMNKSEHASCFYHFTPLKKQETLLAAVNENRVDCYPRYSIEAWNTSLEPVDFDTLENSVEKWFYKFLDIKYKHSSLPSLKSAFLDKLSPFLVSAAIYRINMTPPVFYAIEWDEFVIDGKLGTFLLSFEFSD